MSSIKDRIASAESVRGALVVEYLRFEESALREKLYALDVADCELLRLGKACNANNAREAISVLSLALENAIDIKTAERLKRWDEAERVTDLAVYGAICTKSARRLFERERRNNRKGGNHD